MAVAAGAAVGAWQGHRPGGQRGGAVWAWQVAPGSAGRWSQEAWLQDRVSWQQAGQAWFCSRPSLHVPWAKATRGSLPCGRKPGSSLLRVARLSILGHPPPALGPTSLPAEAWSGQFSGRGRQGSCHGNGRAQTGRSATNQGREPQGYRVGGWKGCQVERTARLTGIGGTGGAGMEPVLSTRGDQPTPPCQSAQGASGGHSIPMPRPGTFQRRLPASDTDLGVPH